jgi:hypothetical protein
VVLGIIVGLAGPVGSDVVAPVASVAFLVAFSENVVAVGETSDTLVVDQLTRESGLAADAQWLGWSGHADVAVGIRALLAIRTDILSRVIFSRNDHHRVETAKTFLIVSANGAIINSAFDASVIASHVSTFTSATDNVVVLCEVALTVIDGFGDVAVTQFGLSVVEGIFTNAANRSAVFHGALTAVLLVGTSG